MVSTRGKQLMKCERWTRPGLMPPAQKAAEVSRILGMDPSFVTSPDADTRSLSGESASLLSTAHSRHAAVCTERHAHRGDTVIFGNHRRRDVHCAFVQSVGTLIGALARVLGAAPRSPLRARGAVARASSFDRRAAPLATRSGRHPRQRL